MSMRSHSSAGILALVLAPLIGCSSALQTSAASPPPPPVQPQASAPTAAADETIALPPSERAAHIEDALSQLKDSERSVEIEIARKKAAPNKIGGAQPSTPPKSGGAKEEPTTEPCNVACVALSSMRRSAEYLCKLSGAADLRCVDARDRVRRAEDRVTTSCGACPTSSPLSLGPLPDRIRDDAALHIGWTEIPDEAELLRLTLDPP